MREDATFYEVLGVDPDADTDTIQAAYRERVKEYHPDVSDHPEARDRFQRINRARTVLADREERARYDRLGHEAYLERQRRGRTDREDAAAGGPDASATGSTATGSGATDATASGAADATSRRRAGDGAGAGTRRRGAGARSRGESRREGSRRGDARTAATADAGGSGREERTGGEATGWRVPGRFAVREALSGVALVGVAGGAVVVTTASGTTVPGSERLLLVGCWTVVALLAGRFAAGSAGALPDGVVRAQAFPLGLFAGAWALHRVGGSAPLVAGLVGYAAFAALFRTSALVARRGRSTLRPAACWFLGTVPAALVLSASRLSVGDAGPVVALRAPDIGGSIGRIPPGSVAVLALAAPVAVALGYAVWRFVRGLA